ncbi:MAG: DinB family protein [bacterium]
MTNSSTADFPGNATPAQLLYPDLADELASTRKMIAIVPDGHNDWKPHEKSMSLATLATHVAELCAFAGTVLNTDELDMATADMSTKVLSTTAERLALFDTLAPEFTAAVESADWQKVAGSWTLRMGPQVYLTGQKSTLLRTLGISHIAHHRAQLGVYLRQLGIPIPGTYGPSADEM